MKSRKVQLEAAFAVAILLAGALFSFYSTRQAVENYSAHKILLEKQAEATREANRQRSLQESMESSNLEATKEAVARNELNMGRSGEKAEVVIEPTPTPSPGAKEPHKEAFYFLEWWHMLTGK